MKKVFFIVALTATSFAGFAQKEKEESKPLSFSVGLEAALPIGDFADFNSFGIGGSVQGEYKVAPELGITLNAGYISYSAKSISVLGVSLPKEKALGVIPVLAGVRYHFSENIYGSGQLGLSFFSGGGSGSNFTYAPGVGFKFSQFDVLVKYVGMSSKVESFNGTAIVSKTATYGAVGIRAAYNF